MSNYILTCCSTADMPYEYFEEKNIPCKFFTYILDGKEYPDDLGKTISFDEYYKKISEGAMPTTSQVNVGQYMEFFEPFLKEGKDILHVAFSSGLSGSYNSATIAREELLAKYPDRKLLIVDSLAASCGYGLLVDIAADLRDNHTPMEEAYDYLQNNKLNVHHWFFSTDLTHYKRGGRISATSAAVGNLLNICPLMNMNNEGKLTPRQKVRGKKHVIKEIVNTMEKHAVDGNNYNGKCFIAHSASLKDARAVQALVEEKFPNVKGKIRMNSIGTVIGAHTGPGTVILSFVGDEREE